MMKRGIRMVLDTAAIKSYMRREMVVGDVLAKQPDGVRCVALPVLCLAEAYRAATAEQAHRLEELYRHPATVVTPVKVDDALMLGDWSKILDSHDLAHAALGAAEHDATLMTAKRKAVNRVLAEGWPIIDL